MNYGYLIRLSLCIVVCGLLLYSYISKQNAITKVRLEIPKLMKQLEVVQQENTRLQFEIDQFENPLHLMEIANRAEYRHLKHPMQNEVIEEKK